MKKLSIILGLILIVFFYACKSNPVSYVGDKERTKSGFIVGAIIDSTSREPLTNVKIIITEIFANSDFADTVTTNELGKFEIGNIFEQEYYLEINTKGYVCRTILVNVKDTLKIMDPVKLQRNRYPYNYISIDEFPTEPESNGYYYQLDPNVFRNDRSWAIPFNESPTLVSKIHRKIDSLTISVIRDDIMVDSLWYRFFQYSCGAFPLEVPADMVIKLEEDNQKILDHNFIPVDLSTLDWHHCFDSTASIANYYFFEQ